MGARVVRMFRNFNLENRVHRELSKEKPLAAPRHAVKSPASGGSSEGECVRRARVMAGLVPGSELSLTGHALSVYRRVCVFQLWKRTPWTRRTTHCCPSCGLCMWSPQTLQHHQHHHHQQQQRSETHSSGHTHTAVCLDRVIMITLILTSGCLELTVSDQPGCSMKSENRQRVEVSALEEA